MPRGLVEEVAIFSHPGGIVSDEILPPLLVVRIFPVETIQRSFHSAHSPDLFGHTQQCPGKFAVMGAKQAKSFSCRFSPRLRSDRGKRSERTDQRSSQRPQPARNVYAFGCNCHLCSVFGLVETYLSRDELSWPGVFSFRSRNEASRAQAQPRPQRRPWSWHSVRGAIGPLTGMVKLVEYVDELCAETIWLCAEWSHVVL